MTNETLNFKSRDGIDLFVKKDIPDSAKTIVVIVHGLCEHLGRYDYVVEKLNSFGYGVYRFDNRGHGLSSGERGYVENFMDFIDDADEIVGLAHNENKRLPIFMLGHSMGGFIAAAYGSKYRDSLKGQILSGAAVTDLPIFEELKESKAFETSPREKSPNALSSLICRDQTVVEAYDNDPLVLKETNLKLLGEAFVKGPDWIKDNIDKYEYPVLILHGENDQIVPKACSQWMYEKIKSSDRELKIYDSCFHEILNEKDEKDMIIDNIHSWIESRL